MSDPRPSAARPQGLLATALLFALFASYGILKPLRDDVGQYFGRDILPRVWLGTAIVTVIVTALLSAAIARWPRRRVAPFVFAAFAALTAGAWVFYDALAPAEHAEGKAFWLPACFYCWVSTYLMVGLALFWGLMADLYGSAAGKRTFGPIAVGGTLGQLGGAAFTGHGAEALGRYAVLGVAVALLLVAAALCVALLARSTAREAQAPGARGGVGGSWFEGFAASLRNPYLAMILGYVALQSFASAVASLEVVEPVKAHFGADRAARVAFNASVDFWAQAITLGFQFALVGPLMTRFGIGIALALQPLAYAVGFVALAFATPEAFLVTIACFEVARRATNYGFAKPSRDALFTVCTPSDKYKAKSVIDAAGFRIFDWVFGESTNAWRQPVAALVGGGVAASATVAVPIALAWAGLSAWLGRMHRRRGG